MVPSKRILIVSPVFESPEGDFARALFHDLDKSNVPVLAPFTNIEWSNLSEIKNYFAIHKPFLVIVALPFGEALRNLFSDNENKTKALAVMREIADVCQRSGASLVCLSDYHVFGGETKSTYSESDPVSPLGEFGRFLVELEGIVSSSVEKHFILRFGWIIGGATNNLFSDILDALVLGGEKEVSRYRRGSPTWQDDGLRVLVAVIRQILAGAENWGIFHYCSSDNCNEWEFGQEVLSTLSAIKEPIGSVVSPADKPSGEQIEPASSTLSCRKIRNNFGVQPRSWRQGLKANVEKWLKENASTI